MKKIVILAVSFLMIAACKETAASTPAKNEVLATAKSLNNATVMITNKSKQSGGSGVIYKSTPTVSLILTNSHVCGVLENGGGLVVTNKGEYVVEKYKRSQVHDICAIEVVADLGVQTPIAESASFGDKALVSGHPFLLPNTLTEGYLSNKLEISILTEVKKCTEQEEIDYPMVCVLLGGMPIIKYYTAQTVSAMIAPGNSGSGVYNTKGEIIGLVFAGMGRSLSHGLIVPLEYVKLFLNEESKKLEWTDSNAAKRASELMEAQSKKAPRKYNIALTKQNIGSLIYPAIKSTEIDYIVEKLEACKKSLSTCSLSKGTK